MMKTTFLSFIFLLILNSCFSPEHEKVLLKSRIDSLEAIIGEKNLSLSFLKKITPNVLVRNAEAGHCTVFLFEPFGLGIEIKSLRPLFNNDNFFCIPAAFTTQTNQIDGLFIENGTERSSVINKTLNGICIVSSDGIQILAGDSLDEKIITKTKHNGNSLFQQILLVNNSKIVDCKFFGQKENLRRAIIQFDNHGCIGESHKSITIKEFQKSLKSIGAVNAIYLDMGTWSEGWYKDYNQNKVVIGEKMTDTNRQTNWLIFEK